MLEQLKRIDRDGIHFVMIGSALIFGLASAVVGHLHPPASEGPALFWWPTSYTFVWLGFCLWLMVLLLVGRSQVLNVKIPHFPLWISVVAVASIVVALWVVSLCRVTVFPDRLESHVLTAHGFETTVYPYSDVTAVKYDCRIGDSRGLDYSELTYQLLFPKDEMFDLAKGRNDGRDKDMWLNAVALADKVLMARGVSKSGVRDTDARASDLSACMDQLKKDRNAQDAAVVTRIFQPSDPTKAPKKPKAPEAA